MLQIYDIELALDQSQEVLAQRVLSKLHLDSDVWTVTDLKLVKKSVDARDKGRIRWVYTLRFSLKRTDGAAVDEEQLVRQARSRKVKLEIFSGADYAIPLVSKQEGPRPVVVGFGPCGIFAAYLLAKAGLRPIVLERGRPVEERIRHVAAYWEDGILREDSNVLFGEGGAGTFSDGKLTTGIGDGRKTFVLKTFAAAGGGEDILYLAKPHLGTDVLTVVVSNLRREILSLGGELRFGQKLVGIGADASGRVSHVIVKPVYPESPNAGSATGNRYQLEAKQVVLAIGHSARDTTRELFASGLVMQQKPFSMGVRIEHPQKLINESQYGTSSRNPVLPVADYKLSCKAGNGRGVYTFCMCPGGQVVAASAEAGTICTNGMSARARDGHWANSAVLVDVRPTDFENDHPLAGMDLQRAVEEKAFALRQELLRAATADKMAAASTMATTGKTVVASKIATNTMAAASKTVHAYTPLCETISDFIGGQSLLARCLPDFVTQGIKDALPCFGRKIRGFDGETAKLYGPETRSSSPVRFLRDETMQGNIRGVYPCGEGAGYAGGIMSAAVDGIKAAEHIIGTWGGSR